jgi:hypothetical protein
MHYITGLRRKKPVTDFFVSIVPDRKHFEMDLQLYQDFMDSDPDISLSFKCHKAFVLQLP